MRRDAGPFDTSRVVRAELTFVSGGGRTLLARQFVPYPFHITRPFYLDRARPDLATLYLQSAAGGLYRGDDLELALSVNSGGAHVTTQAATIVHDCGTQPAVQSTRLSIGENGFLAYTPDLQVMFPGANLRVEMLVTLKRGASAVITDGYTWHDPIGANRIFHQLWQRLDIRDETGRCLVKETAAVAGSDIVGSSSPIGQYRAFGSALLLGTPTAMPDTSIIVSECDRLGCLAGSTELPNGAGRLVRCLAPDGQTLRGVLHTVFEQGFRSTVGFAPALRRK